MAQISETISIDYEVVESMAKSFQGSGEVMQSVAQAMETAITILKASALLGNPGNMALAHYLERIKPNLDRLAATCQEMSGDLVTSVNALKEGDSSGSAKFNK